MKNLWATLDGDLMWGQAKGNTFLELKLHLVAEQAGRVRSWSQTAGTPAMLAAFSFNLPRD